MCQYADEQTDGQLPDCQWNCPHSESNWNEPVVRSMCEDCWRESVKPYRDFTELFVLALDFLEREDIGLHHPEILNPKEEQAILLVRRLLKKEEYLKMRDKMQKMERDSRKLADVRDAKFLDG